MTGPDDVAAERKARAATLLTAIAERRRELAEPLLTEDVTWWVPQSAGARGIERPLRGRQAVLDLCCGESRYRVGTMHWDPHQLLHDDDTVVVHCTLRALTKGGVSYENHYALVYRFVGDRIAEAWEHTDTAYAFGRFEQAT